MALSVPALGHEARSLTPSPEPAPRDLAKRGKQVLQEAAAEQTKDEEYTNYSVVSATAPSATSGDNVFLSNDSTFNMILYCLKELTAQNRVTVKSIQRSWIHGVCGNAKDPHSFGSKLDTSIYDFSKVCTSVFRMTCLRCMNINEKLWPAMQSPCDKRNHDILRYEQVYGPPVVLTQTYAKARRLWSDLDRLYPHFAIEMCAEDLLDKRKRSIALDNCIVIFRKFFQEVIEITITVDMEKGLDKIYNCDVAATLCKRSISEGPDAQWMSTLKLLINGPIMSIKKHYQMIKSIATQKESAVECCSTYLTDLPDSIDTSALNSTGLISAYGTNTAMNTATNPSSFKTNAISGYNTTAPSGFNTTATSGFNSTATSFNTALNSTYASNYPTVGAPMAASTPMMPPRPFVTPPSPSKDPDYADLTPGKPPAKYSELGNEPPKKEEEKSKSSSRHHRHHGGSGTEEKDGEKSSKHHGHRSHHHRDKSADKSSEKPAEKPAESPAEKDGESKSAEGEEKKGEHKSRHHGHHSSGSHRHSSGHHSGGDKAKLGVEGHGHGHHRKHRSHSHDRKSSTESVSKGDASASTSKTEQK